MGHTVLSSQFLSGLCKEIKVKLAGMEGVIEQLLVTLRKPNRETWVLLRSRQLQRKGTLE